MNFLNNLRPWIAHTLCLQTLCYVHKNSKSANFTGPDIQKKIAFFYEEGRSFELRNAIFLNIHQFALRQCE